MLILSRITILPAWQLLNGADCCLSWFQELPNLHMHIQKAEILLFRELPPQNHWSRTICTYAYVYKHGCTLTQQNEQNWEPFERKLYVEINEHEGILKCVEMSCVCELSLSSVTIAYTYHLYLYIGVEICILYSVIYTPTLFHQLITFKTVDTYQMLLTLRI